MSLVKKVHFYLKNVWLWMQGRFIRFPKTKILPLHAHLAMLTHREHAASIRESPNVTFVLADIVCFVPTVQRLTRNCRRLWNRQVIWRSMVRWGLDAETHAEFLSSLMAFRSSVTVKTSQRLKKLKMWLTLGCFYILSLAHRGCYIMNSIRCHSYRLSHQWFNSNEAKCLCLQTWSSLITHQNMLLKSPEGVSCTCKVRIALSLRTLASV